MPKDDVTSAAKAATEKTNPPQVAQAATTDGKTDTKEKKGKEKSKDKSDLLVVKRPSIHWANYVIIGVLAVAVGFVVWQTRLALSPVSASDGQPVAQATLPPIPTLTLNKNHKRQGPTVQVDEGQIGRDNPFLKP